MKKLLLTLVLFALVTMGFAQTTYYWAGGATATSLTGSDWSTTLGGAASTSRSALDDILVFDNQTVSFSITGVTIGKLVIKTGADVTFTRGEAGTTTLALAGVAGVGLDVDGGILRVNGSTSGFNFTMSLPTGVTGSVRNAGQVFISGTAINRISGSSAGSLVFETGTSCTINSVGSAPFDTFSNTAVENTTIFKNGSTINYLGGISPFGTTSSATITSMEPGSNFIFNIVPASGFFNSRVFGNVRFITGVTVSLSSENFIKMNDLTIDNGASFTLRNSGGQAIGGNILNNGTLGVNSTIGSSTIIMTGNSPQTISGTGTFNPLGLITVGNDANVILERNLIFNGTNTGNVIGTLNFKTSTISGTAKYQFRTSASTSETGNTTAGSNSISMGSNYATISPSVGLLVSGPGIPANSYIIGTSSGSSAFTISNFATATGTGVTISLTGGNPTLETSNTGGSNASLLTTGTTKSLGSGSNIIINGATSAPFPVTSATITSSVFSSFSNLTNLTINAATTTNVNATIEGQLTLGSSKLTLRTGDELTMTGVSLPILLLPDVSPLFVGMNASTYIVTPANTSTGEVGIVKLVGVATSRLIPVGSATNYLPVTVNPTAASNFSINVFQGATADATPNGTALTAGEKADRVDAIYNINRTSGTGNCVVTLGWQAGLEGASFSGFTSPQVGVAKYTTSYSAFAGPGDNITNTISTVITDDVFGQFLVGKSQTLPVSLISFTAKVSDQTTVLNWKTTSESNLSHYLIQRSSNGVNFETLSSVSANNKAGVFNYSFVDKAPVFGANYYRLISVDIDGSTDVSDLQSVNLGSVATLSVYPNPTKSTVTIKGLVQGDVVKITDLLGRSVSSAIYNGDDLLNLSLADSNVGIYLLTVSNNGKVTSTQRIVKN